MHKLTFILLIVGGLNWLLVALFGADLGAWVLGGMDSILSRVVYGLVGLAAVFEVVSHKKTCKTCSGGSKKVDMKSDMGGASTGQM